MSSGCSAQIELSTYLRTSLSVMESHGVTHTTGTTALLWDQQHQVYYMYKDIYIYIDALGAVKSLIVYKIPVSRCIKKTN